MDSQDPRYEHFQLVYRRCLESVAPAENEEMRKRTQLTWRDTKVSQMWGRLGAGSRRRWSKDDVCDSMDD